MRRVGRATQGHRDRTSSDTGKDPWLRLGQEGASVWINWYFAKSAGTSTRHDDAEAVEQAGAKTGVRVIAVRAEVGDADDLRAIVAKAAQAFGGLVPVGQLRRHREAGAVPRDLAGPVELARLLDQPDRRFPVHARRSSRAVAAR